MAERLKIAIVGPCGSGKSTLAEMLTRQGYNARQIAQEHSFAPRMWRVITNPDLLIFLDASFATCQARKRLNWNALDHEEQERRLAHARERCDIYIKTDKLNPQDILDLVLASLDVGHDSSAEV